MAMSAVASDAAFTAPPKTMASIADAYPELRPLTFSARLGADRWLFPLDIAADGRIIGIAVDVQHVDRELIEYQPGTSAYRSLFKLKHTANSKPQILQLGSAVEHAGRVVFTQENEDGDVWTLYSVDRSGANLHVLANNTTVQGKPCPASISALSVANAWVYWSACASLQGAVTLSTYRAPVSGGATAELVRTQSAAPQTMADDGLVLSMPDAHDRTVGAIFELRNPTSLQASATLLAQGPVLTYGAGSRLVAWTTPALDRIYVRSRARAGKDQPQATLSLPAATPVDPTVWEDYIAWQQDDGPRLFDVQRHMLVRLAQKLDRPRLAKGYLLWGESPGEPSVHALFSKVYHLVSLSALTQNSRQQ